MNELRKLVMRYIAEPMAFEEFRRAFVQQFLTTARADESLQWKIASIESMCSDFSEGIFDEATLKTNMLTSLRTEALSATVEAGCGIQYGDSFGSASTVEITAFPALWNSSGSALPSIAPNAPDQPAPSIFVKEPFIAA